MMAMNSNNSKYRRALCFATAASILQSSHVIDAFTQPDQCRRVLPHNIFESTLMMEQQKNDVNNSVVTALSDHIPPTDILPIIGADVELPELEFLGSSLSPLDRASSDTPLFMTMSEEQREFELKLGKALDT